MKQNGPLPGNLDRHENDFDGTQRNGTVFPLTHVPTAQNSLCASFAFRSLSGIEWRPDRHSQPMIQAQQFEAFMQNYQNMVFSTAMRLLANQTEAEDISQEVFLKAYERFEELSQSPTVGGWLKTVATNMSLNHLSRDPS